MFYTFFSYYKKQGIHIGVGFCVARSDRVGNAKASKCGMSSKHRFPRYFFLYGVHIKKQEKNRPIRGNLADTTFYNYEKNNYYGLCHYLRKLDYG